MTEPLDLLIFGAHPDDAEIGMGATIAKHTEAGRRVGICDLTCAELSSNGTVETRKREAAEAAAILGIAVRTNLGLPDRGLYLCKEHIETVVAEIRKHRPRLVFAPYWQDRHPDHVLCSQLVQEAVFNAKLRRYLPETEATAVEQLYYYFINDLAEPDVMIDISAWYRKKQDALRAFGSQFIPSLGNGGVDYVETPLTQGYLERVEARDRLLGQKRMVEYAEGFVTRLPLMVHLF